MISDMGNQEDPFAHLPKILTVEETAELLRVTDQSLRNLIKEGKIPAIRLGRVLRIYRNELVEALEEARVTGDDVDESDD